ncbi:MAG: tRNA (guanosine(46)-N7)-methyltransferase TrmB [Planctomycetes bacterium]|nr:tRNA (guanosine(46)-N7)-methyltransferase TrmB [Planctomycetota bacterium]
MARPLSVSLQEYVVDWKLLPWPIPWSEVFGRRAPLVLEIGFGNGTFLTEQGARRPERDHVGIELSWTAATHLFRRLQAAELTNVRALLGNAEELVRHNFVPGQLDEVFVNHPCPWPKSRHVERRLLARSFLALLAERMRPGAKLTVVTDHADYARWLGDELAEQSALVSCHATTEVASLPERTPTKYQLKAMVQGIPIHYFEWRKADGAAEIPVPTERAAEISMPTMTLAGAVEPAELFQGFAPQLFRERYREVEVVVKLIAVYQRPDAPVWLLECFVLEDQLQQQFALDVVLRGPSVLLKPSALGQPYPTHGVKRAVWCAARWLQSRHPALVLQYESLGLRPPAEPWPL